MESIDEELYKIKSNMYFRRDGTPYVNALEWAKDFEKYELKRVARTNLWWGGSVSTVWLGLNHNYGGGRPLIFETMVFGRSSWSELDMDRYSTEQEALAGHELMVEAWKWPFRKLFKHFMGKLLQRFK